MPKAPDEFIDELLRARRSRREERPTRALIIDGKQSSAKIKSSCGSSSSITIASTCRARSFIFSPTAP
jgi:hypothetical protein